jgi:hypothetical protein
MMTREIDPGPLQWDILLRGYSRETQTRFLVACADCREDHGGWCRQHLMNDSACPLLDAAGQPVTQLLRDNG